METSPHIIMKCPKCAKEYPLDRNHCEDCSAMLEPVEVEKQRQSPVSGKTRETLSGGSPNPSSESIADIKIDSLKADIEDKFISTLFYELEQLKKRLSKKEKSLSELQVRGAEMDHTAFLKEVGDREQTIDDLIKKIAKLESTLTGLMKKIEADIENISSQMRNTEKPGHLWFLNKTGRYHRMLASELEKKEILLDILRKKKSPAYFRHKKQQRIYVLLALTAVLTLTLSWQFFSYIYTGGKGRPAEQVRLGKSMPDRTVIQEQDIHDLLADIKRANLTKNLDLWESRYSSQYLQLPGKRANIVDQWKKVDYKSLRYEVAELKIESDRASALVTWDMLVFLKSNKVIKNISVHLYSEFVIEDDRLKISSVSKL